MDSWSVSTCNFDVLLEGGNVEGATSVQSLSHVRLFATPWAAASQASLSISNSRSLLKLMSTESVMLTLTRLWKLPGVLLLLYH